MRDSSLNLMLASGWSVFDRNVMRRENYSNEGTEVEPLGTEGWGIKRKIVVSFQPDSDAKEIVI